MSLHFFGLLLCAGLGGMCIRFFILFLIRRICKTIFARIMFLSLSAFLYFVGKFIFTNLCLQICSIFLLLGSMEELYDELQERAKVHWNKQ